MGEVRHSPCLSFCVTTKCGKVHDFVDKDERMLCGGVYGLNWFQSLLRLSEQDLEDLQQELSPSVSKRPRLARGVKRKICYAED